MPLSDDPSRELLRLTHAMVLAAKEGAWEEVGEMETQRQALLAKLEAVISALGCDEFVVTNNMREILLLNSRMLDLGQEIKAELAKAIIGLSKGRKAVSAYYGVR